MRTSWAGGRSLSLEMESLSPAPERWDAYAEGGGGILEGRSTANTRLICSSSSSSRLESVDSWIGCGVLGAKITSERSSLRMTVPRLKTTARSTTLRSSLMLPGHEYGIRAFLASSEN